MKALVLEAKDQPLTWKEVNKPTLQPGEVLVQIKAAALNRRDYWITIGKYAGIKYPSILGSDGAGIVVEVGSEAEAQWLSKEVIINPSNNWGDHPEFQGKDFTILGLPQDGTFAEFIKIKAEYLHPKPTHLTWEQAAAVPLAGLTAYRALFTKAHLHKGDKVLIIGAGSGTGTFALQWAIAAGCQVFVTSGTGDKIDKAKKLGAAAGVSYKAQDWVEQLQQLAGGFDVIVDSAIGPEFDKVLDLANPGARIVTFGATAGDTPALPARKIFWKQLQILGTTMGTKEDFTAMLDMLNSNQIVPVIDEVFPMSEANAAIKKMGESGQFGKLVLQA